MLRPNSVHNPAVAVLVRTCQAGRWGVGVANARVKVSISSFLMVLSSTSVILIVLLSNKWIISVPAIHGWNILWSSKSIEAVCYLELFQHVGDLRNSNYVLQKVIQTVLLKSRVMAVCR